MTKFCNRNSENKKVFKPKKGSTVKKLKAPATKGALEIATQTSRGPLQNLNLPLQIKSSDNFESAHEKSKPESKMTNQNS